MIQHVPDRPGHDRRYAIDATKIRNAILKAGRATGDFDEMEAQLLTAQVVKVLTHTGYRQQIPEIERIQDIVEQVLINVHHRAQQVIEFLGKIKALHGKTEQTL